MTKQHRAQLRGLLTFIFGFLSGVFFIGSVFNTGARATILLALSVLFMFANTLIDFWQGRTFANRDDRDTGAK